MKQPTVYALVRRKDGSIVKRPIRFDSTNFKLKEKISGSLQADLFRKFGTVQTKKILDIQKGS